MTFTSSLTTAFNSAFIPTAAPFAQHTFRSPLRTLCCTPCARLPPNIPPPRRRAAALTVLAASSALSVPTGGPALAATTALFAIVGVAAEAPAALIAPVAVLCAALVDLVAINVAGVTLDTGPLPFILVVLGGATAFALELNDAPLSDLASRPTDIPLPLSHPSDSNPVPELEEEPHPAEPNHPFDSWDDKFNMRR